ncbi:MAG: hypothetical protein ACKPKO_42470, partial [Candidatus Fonsibacter sp.]
MFMVMPPATSIACQQLGSDRRHGHVSDAYCVNVAELQARQRCVSQRYYVAARSICASYLPSPAELIKLVSYWYELFAYAMHHDGLVDNIQW